MASLIVRNLDDGLVQKLREQAAAHGRSVEAEHRAILASALQGIKKRSFAEALLDIPDVGEDADFARTNHSGEAPDVFG